MPETTENIASDANASQIEFWNSAAGEKWISYEERLDGGLSSVKNRLIERAAIKPGERVVEIGCGTGGTTLDLARRVGGTGSVLAVDVSEPLLARAEQRVADQGICNTSFSLADAQTHAFEQGSADALVSRFGVMFFADPVAAFANMRRVLKPGGRLSFVSWATMDLNPWFAIPREIAVARLGEPEAGDPDAPGPLAFRDLDRVSDILRRAGFAGIAADEEAVDLVFPGSVRQVAELAGNLGPASRIIAEKDGTPEDRAAITDAIAERIAGYAQGEGVGIPARLNFFDAVAG